MRFKKKKKNVIKIAKGRRNKKKLFDRMFSHCGNLILDLGLKQTRSCVLVAPPFHVLLPELDDSPYTFPSSMVSNFVILAGCCSQSL